MGPVSQRRSTGRGCSACGTWEADVLVWVLLVVLAACGLAWAVWPPDPVMVELLPLVLAGAVFLIICAVEARH
jgi:hypothetical protein